MCTAGEDYTLPNLPVFNVTISAGSTSSSFMIDIIDDMIQEDNETFNIEIRLLSNCLSSALAISSSTVTITDNDGTINFNIVKFLVIMIIITVTVFVVAKIQFASSMFSGDEASGRLSVVIIILGGVTSSKDINIPIMFTNKTATGWF